MTQIEALPEVSSAPAPWALKGQGYIFAVLMPEAVLERESFIPESLAGSRRGRLAYAMFVDYAESDAGPYHELLYIPGSFQFSDARRLSISKIYVSSWSSVVNGRRNWGIPKERCDFFVNYGADNVDRLRLIAEDGTVFASLELEHRFLRLPLPGHWAPGRLRTLSQHFEGTEFTFTPEARGHIKWAKVRHWEFDSRYFPDLARGQVIAALKVTDFNMVFPVARQQKLGR